ncbi:unnamed protein product, partial [Didymodactylos carnosus]
KLNEAWQWFLYIKYFETIDDEYASMVRESAPQALDVIFRNAASLRNTLFEKIIQQPVLVLPDKWQLYFEHVREEERERPLKEENTKMNEVFQALIQQQTLERQHMTAEFNEELAKAKEGTCTLL